MIKINKHGEIKKKLYIWDNVVCPKCGCEFSCDNRNVAQFRYPVDICYVKCPDCKSATINLEYSDARIEEVVESLG